MPKLLISDCPSSSNSFRVFDLLVLVSDHLLHSRRPLLELDRKSKKVDHDMKDDNGEREGVLKVWWPRGSVVK